jgi:hypothetical protein
MVMKIDSGNAQSRAIAKRALKSSSVIEHTATWTRLLADQENNRCSFRAVKICTFLNLHGFRNQQQSAGIGWLSVFNRLGDIMMLQSCQEDISGPHESTCNQGLF